MDALSEVLRLARFTAGVTLDATARAPWCVTVSSSASVARVHVVLEGECVIKSASAAPPIGAAAERARLAELVVIEALSRYVYWLPPGGTGWLAALNDRYVGRALALVHGRPSEPWTVEKLGRQVGLSRSALADHFSQVMGEPIFAYLTRWRLQLAAEFLLTTRRPIAAIAHEAGYESAGAFSAAFKRVFGKPPSTWRKASKRR